MGKSNTRQTTPIEDLFSPPPQAEELEPESLLYDYGIGIDCHSRFIQVCVLVLHEKKLVRHEKEFGTPSYELINARGWIREVLSKYELDASDFHYTLESTGCYHWPVIHAFEGHPHVVNPLLAGHTRRKTDKLDARLLARQGITGMWPESYIAPWPVQELRMLMGHRTNAKRQSLRTRNRIGGILLRHGYTFHVTLRMNESKSLAIIEDMLDGRTDSRQLSPTARPISEVCTEMMRDLIVVWQGAEDTARRYLRRVRDQLHKTFFHFGQDEVDGKTALKLLKSVPGVGDIAAITYLLEVVDGRRFPSSKAVAAYGGFDPSLKVSAGKVTAHVRRKGNQLLHTALFAVGPDRNAGPVGAARPLGLLNFQKA